MPEDWAERAQALSPRRIRSTAAHLQAKQVPRHHQPLEYPARMRTVLAALAFVVSAGGAHAQQKVPTVSELLRAEAKATEACEAGGDPAIVAGQCRLRERVSGRLAQAGWCYGRKGQTDKKRNGTPAILTPSTRTRSRLFNTDSGLADASHMALGCAISRHGQRHPPCQCEAGACRT